MAIEIEGVARKSMVMFFLIDTSGSMAGRSIASVNDAMREVIPDIQDISDSNADTNIKLAVMDFADNPKWISSEPQELSSVSWTDLGTYGGTNMGKAFKELASKLSTDEFLNDPSGNKAPVVILLTDGAPGDNYREGIKVLNQNPWFKKSIKVALGVEDARMSVLEEFTGNKESAIYLKDKGLLKRLLHVVSVSASVVGSKTSINSESDASAAQEAVIENVKEEMENSVSDDEW